MARTISRRGLLRIAGGTTAALGISTIAGELHSAGAAAQNGPGIKNPLAAEMLPTVSVGSGVQLFYRDDSFVEPWLTPEPVLMIHGAGESSLTWFGWVPRMAREFRVIRPDLPGYGHSTAPRDFDLTLPNLARVLAGFLDAIKIDSAHIIGAKMGGAISMQFAADYPRRTRTLVLAGAAFTTPAFNDPKSMPNAQYDRLGSAASKEEVEYWNKIMGAPGPAGVGKAVAALNMDPVLPRITAPTLVITTDRSTAWSVESVISHQKKIPKSRLLVLTSDAYHVAVAKPDECVTNVLAFIKNETT